MTPLVILGSVYVAICVTMFVAQRRFLYGPDPTSPDRAQAGVSDMRVERLRTADGLELLAWYRAPESERMPVVVYLHGNAGHIGDRGYKMRPLLDAGVGVLLLSYRGYGGNAGEPSEQGLYSDARAAIAFLAAQGIGRERLVIYGESMGSGVAVQIATETPPAALILEAPFTSLTKVAFEKVPYIPVPLLIRDRFDSLSKIGRVHAPLLVIHGERDKTVRIHHGRKLLAAANEPKQGLFLPEAGHNDLYAFGVAETMAEFVLGAVAPAEAVEAG